MQNVELRNESIHTAVSTMVIVRSCVICPVWILLCFPSVLRTENCNELNHSEIIREHHIHQGLSTTINCPYRKNRSQFLTVSLRTKHRLCEYYYLNESWSKKVCNENISFIWSPETEEISFQLRNLQINSSGVYTCTVEQNIPPPTVCLGQKRISIHVKASPSVSVSCVKGTDGAPTVLCASECYYPAELTQAWLRDGEYISYFNTSMSSLYEETLQSSHVSWNYSNNIDGSYSIMSYLHLSSNTEEQVVYYCWVNHSALNKSITVSISSTECTEREKPFIGELFIGITFGVMAGIAMILAAGCYQSLRKRRRIRIYFQSTVDSSSLPESEPPPTPQSQRNHQPITQVYSTLWNHQPEPDVYSTLGNHQPIPCRSNSNETAYSSL